MRRIKRLETALEYACSRIVLNNYVRRHCPDIEETNRCELCKAGNANTLKNMAKCWKEYLLTLPDMDIKHHTEVYKKGATK